MSSGRFAAGGQICFFWKISARALSSANGCNVIYPRITPLSTVLTLATTTDLSKEDITFSIDSHDLIPQSNQAKSDDLRIIKVQKWLEDLVRLPGLSDSEYSTFIRYCTEFFVDKDRLWRKNEQGVHKLVIPSNL
jgi:hypothetical protein